jgi:hypothetical protein
MLVMVRIKPSKIWYVLKSRPVPKSTCLDHHPTKKLEIDHQTFQFNHRIPGSKLEENSNDKTQRRPAPTKTGRFWIIFAADTKSPGSSRVHLGCINLIPYSLSVGRGYNLYNQRLIGSLPRHCWITAGSPPMSVAPLPLFGERHLLQATQGICIGFTAFSCRKMRCFAA